jgi:hypothetical protein
MTTLAELLTPKVRAWTYATLAVVVPLITLLVAVLADGWQWVDLALIVTSVAASAGFGVARANTPTGTPPPDPLGGVADGPDIGAITLQDIVLVLAAIVLVIVILSLL